MSNTPFIESTSADPIERAIARKVTRILNDSTLDRKQRETLVRRAQRDLLEHRKRQEQQTLLSQQVQAISLPRGFRPQTITVRNGRVHLGAVNRNQAFVWLDAGQAPEGVAANRLPFAPVRMQQSRDRSTRKSLEQSIAERRKALGYRQAWA